MNIKSILTVTTIAASISLSPMAMSDNILAVISDKAMLELKDNEAYRTGFYLNELMHSVKE